MSTPQYEIRASYTPTSLVVYQAYHKAIALPALQAQRFVPPFSFSRMTWIKPSFLWMMERCGWAQKPNQEFVVAVHIKRSAWENALDQAVLTTPERNVYSSPQEWEKLFKKSPVRVQWDPERSIRGGKLDYRSIQVGISRHVIEAYANEWIVKIEDCTPLVHKIYKLRKAGDYDNAKKHLPKERVYPLPPEIGKKIGMGGV